MHDTAIGTASVILCQNIVQNQMQSQIIPKRSFKMKY